MEFWVLGLRFRFYGVGKKKGFGFEVKGVWFMVLYFMV
jgi:hypothetical protein